MKRGMKIADGEVSLPKGVVAQMVLSNSKGHLELSKNYPLGLFKDHDLLEEYRNFVGEVNKHLATTPSKKELESDSYWSERLTRKELIDQVLFQTLTMVVVMNREAFLEANIEVFLCHRPRIEPETHTPIIDRWIEFVDRTVADTDYQSAWNMERTLLAHVAECIKTKENVCVCLPDVGVLKLLPIDRGGREVLENKRGRLDAILSNLNVETEFEFLKSELVVQPYLKKSGLWKNEEVSRVVGMYAPSFQQKGVDIFYCRLFCFRTYDVVFQWIEFVDLSRYPHYTPQYVYRPTGHREKPYKLDKYSDEWYKPNKTLESFRRTAQLMRGRCVHFSKPPPTNWFKGPDL